MNNMNVPMRGLYKRGDIYWIAYKAVGSVIRESTGTPDRKLAESVLAKRRAEVFEGRWIGRCRDTRTPVRQAIQEFLTVYSQPRKVSWKDDRFVLGRFATFLGPNTDLQKIDRRTVERFQVELLAHSISKARVNRYIAALKCFFNRCIDWGKLQANPCKGIKLYPETPRTHCAGSWTNHPVGRPMFSTAEAGSAGGVADRSPSGRHSSTHMASHRFRARADSDHAGKDPDTFTAAHERSIG